MDANVQEKKAKAQGAGNIEDAVTAGHGSVEKAVQAGQETTGNAAKAGAEALRSGYDLYLAQAREQLERVLPEAAGRFDDFANFGKGTAVGFIKAGDVAAEALESIGDDSSASFR